MALVFLSDGLAISVNGRIYKLVDIDQETSYVDNGRRFYFSDQIDQNRLIEQIQMTLHYEILENGDVRGSFDATPAIRLSLDTWGARSEDAEDDSSGEDDCRDLAFRLDSRERQPSETFPSTLAA